jgi:hypothetical protein
MVQLELKIGRYLEEHLLPPRLSIVTTLNQQHMWHVTCLALWLLVIRDRQISKRWSVDGTRTTWGRTHCLSSTSLAFHFYNFVVLGQLDESPVRVFSSPNYPSSFLFLFPSNYNDCAAYSSLFIQLIQIIQLNRWAKQNKGQISIV